MNLQVSDLSLKQKIGQMFICGFGALIPNDHARKLIEDHHVGGIVYFRRNVQKLSELSALSSSLQELAASSGQPPLIVAIDQEGGMVARIDHEGISRIPGNMALGATGSEEYTYQVGRIGAKELRALGVNMNFAPCIDVNNNSLNPVIGVRSFGEDPKAVAAHGVAAIRGYQEEGVSATAKHFPGHGDTSVDSHLGLASVPHDRSRLEQVELYPFKKAIENHVDAIMTAHVSFPAFESEPIPATLSHAVLTGLLREEMGFSGLIITDCLEMHAISKGVGIPEGAIRSIEAGADCVLVSHRLEEQEAAIQAVLNAVQTGRISEERIDESVERILSLKMRNGSTASSLQAVDNESISRESKVLLSEIAGKGITLVRDKEQLPLSREVSTLVYWPELLKATQVDEAWSHSYTLGDAAAALGGVVEEIRIGTELSDAEVEAAVQEAARYKQIVVATYTSESRLPSGQRKLVEKLMELDSAKLIVASTRNPYDLNDLPELSTYLCCYENTPFYMDALAGVLYGEVVPEGKLPVTLHDKHEAGSKA